MEKRSGESVNLYGHAYGQFAATPFERVRQETYGEEFGQSGWMTADELRQFAAWLDLGKNSRVLDVCSGSGGPAAILAQNFGCHVTGVDANASGVENGRRLAAARRLDSLLRFEHADADEPIPLPDASFDAILCVDAIIHLQDRTRVLADWRRLLSKGGRVLYTDPTIVSGIVSKEEIAIRSSIGHFVFTPPGENERLLAAAGVRLLRAHDGTENAIRISQCWHEARARWREELVRAEGEANFEGMQRFLEVVHRLTSERRLTRWVFVAEKPA